jgi:hypothetical protein
MAAQAPPGTGVPPTLKAINKFILQAKKLDKVDPIIAYYCRMYAMQLAIGVKNRDKAANEYLQELKKPGEDETHYCQAY